MRIHVIISGRVQGVFFRSETKNFADFLGLLGWVKNRPDGKVEALFEGSMDKVNKMISWCRKGPSGAKVLAVLEKPELSKEKFDDFKIKY